MKLSYQSETNSLWNLWPKTSDHEDREQIFTIYIEHAQLH